MAFKLSTALQNWMLDFSSLRKAFENAVIKIYSGTAPTYANDAATGVLLCTISKASGTVSLDEEGTNKITQVTVTAPNTSTTVSLGGVAFNVNALSATLSVINTAIALAEKINDTSYDCVAVASGTDGILYVMSRIDGETFATVGTLNTSVSDKIAAVDSDTLSFLSLAVAGVLSKNADTWSGVNVATGTAGYFRMVTSGDTGVLVTTTEKRLQGNISTSGAEMNLSNLNLTLGATLTVDSFTITLPAT